ncbi:MAG: DUF4433 domain-containing protein [Deferrisomatales bacterium]
MAQLNTLLNPERALIFRITHIENVPWILENGLHCRNSNCQNPNYRDIGNPDLIAKRTARPVPIAPGGTLSDYIPFYFTPYSPMLYNIKTGYMGMRQTPMPDIVVLVASLRELAQAGVRFVFTDRHAYLAAAQFYNDLNELGRIDWPLLQARDFKRDPDDPGKFERYQAEALLHLHLPVANLAGLVCHGPKQERQMKAWVEESGNALQVVCRPGWYV